MGTLLLLVVCLILVPYCSGSVIDLFSTPNVNCSQYCNCETRNIEDVLEEYSNKQSSLIGKDYRSEVDGNPFSPHVGFFGTALSVLKTFKTIVKITCMINDRVQHGMSELLNGADLHFYTYLNVQCMNNEELFWDLHIRRTTVNILRSKNCNIKPSQSGSIEIPLNLWILEINGGNQNQFENIGLAYTTSVVSFIITESSLRSIPKQWSQSSFHSSNVISLRNNALQQYQCDIPMFKSLDTLNLAGNEIAEFPKCLLEPNGVDITYLVLSDNKIEDISALFKTEEHLTVPNIGIIDMRNNRILKLDELNTMPGLTKLDISENSIAYLRKDTFRNTNNLKMLSLANNRILHIEEQAFRSLKVLETLDLSGNKLLSINQAILPVFSSDLTTDLRNNEFGHPPFGDCKNNQTSFLYANNNYRFFIEDNPLQCDCSASPVNKCLRWLETKELYDSFYKDIEQAVCSAPYAVKGKNYVDTLKMSSCFYTDRCPSACTCTFEDEELMVVNCSSAGLKNIPDNIPTITSFSLEPNVKLFLNNNKLQEIGYRPYFQHLVELHLHNSRISKITTGAMEALQNIRILTLHENRMEKLPSSMANMSFDHLENITLHGNKWACTSDQMWLPKWMNNHKTALFMPERILCNTILPQPLLTLEEDMIRYYHVLSAVIAGLMTTVCFAFILRHKLTELVYVKLNMRLMNMFIYGDIYSLYDAFVFYSQHDYKWVVETLVRILEEGDVRYKLCLHFRDFPQNEVAMDNIPWAVRMSRCSILLLTNKFLNTEWRLPELKDILVEHLLSTNRVVVVAAEDVQWQHLPAELQRYMGAHPFLRLGEPDFWSKLRLYLPPPRIDVAADKKGEAARMSGAAGDQPKLLAAKAEAAADADLGAQDNTR